MAPKAKIRKNWRDVRREMYIRCRLSGSEVRWFWLARIIRGNSQQDKTRRGVDKPSVARYRLRVVHPVSEVFFNQVKLAVAISRLWRRLEGHNHLLGVSHVVGIISRVGMRIISIVGG